MDMVTVHMYETCCCRELSFKVKSEMTTEQVKVEGKKRLKSKYPFLGLNDNEFYKAECFINSRKPHVW